MNFLNHTHGTRSGQSSQHMAQTVVQNHNNYNNISNVTVISKRSAQLPTPRQHGDTINKPISNQQYL
jgi:hypothetical protein